MLRAILFIFYVLCLSLGQAQTFQSSNLPIVIINTNGASIPDEPKITADMSVIYNGPGIRNNLSDTPNAYNGKIGIELRGSSSRVLFPKKQYAVETRDASGNDNSVSLLGLPSEEDWVLSAPYNDKTLMRDVLAYKLGRDLGRYAPRTRYCEVVLNGSYDGVYFLNEKIKRDKNRVNIAGLNPDEVSGDDLTGGYIIKLDKYDGSVGPGFDSNFPPIEANRGQKISFQYEYPSWDEIVDAQKAYIKDYINTFETVLAGENYADPVEGYAKYIDVDSFVDFVIMNEITKNVDGYRLSTFIYKQKDSDGGKLHMGPIWDFNLGFGNADYCTGGSPTGFVFEQFNAVCGDDTWLIPFWWNRLFLNQDFGQRVADRWASLRADKFSTAKIHAYIDSVAAVLNVEAQQRNFQRWPGTLGSYVWPNYYVGQTYASEINWMKDWIAQRTSWLDNEMPKLVTSLEQESLLSTPIVFPNPFESAVTVSFDLKREGNLEVECISIVGQSQTVFSNFENMGPKVIQMNPNATPGMHLYRIKLNGNTLWTGKLLKK